MDAQHRRTGNRQQGPWLTQQRRHVLWAFFFISPWFIGFVILLLGPMLWSLWLSFTDYDPLVSDTEYIGLENYREAVADPRVRSALWNTLYFTVFYVPGTVLSGLGLAMMLTKVGKRSGNFFRTAFYVPNVAPAVAVGAMFLLLLNGQEGLVNQALDVFGIDGPSWLNDPAWIKPGIIMMMLWSVGTTVVILYAALRNVPVMLYEAALVDGASAWRRFRSITVPMISGSLFFVLVINTIAALQLFAEVYAMFFGEQETGAGTSAARFYVVYLFQQAFQFFNMGYASALAWLLFLVIGIITAVQILTSRRWVYYEGE
jgi:multiple sugar transport system permease protein